MNVERAYVAGFLDGEGCFTIGTSITVKCAHTHEPTLLWLKELFGGSIREHNDPSHRKKAWVWSVHSEDAVILIEKILPYLREKKEKAELLLEYQTTVGKRGKRVSEEDLEKRKRIKGLVIAR